MTRVRLGLTARERATAFVAALGLALVTADVVVGGYLTHIDGQMHDTVPGGDKSGPGWLEWIGTLGDVRLAIPIMLAAAIVAAQQTWRLWPAVFTVGTFAAVELAVLALKTAVGRDGPGVWGDRANYPGYFPSGHAATAATVVAVIAFLVIRIAGPRRLVRRAPLVSLVIGLSVGLLAGVRALVIGTHWATDVLGALLLATALLVPALAACREALDGDDIASVAGGSAGESRSGGRAQR
jgi:membrane-associated phospholipid phosphatase